MSAEPIAKTEVPEESSADVAEPEANDTVTAAEDNEPTDFSDESYVCDRQYAIMLTQLMAIKDREKAYKWIQR